MNYFLLKEILKATAGEIINNKKEFIAKGISTDTRTLKEGDLFIALKGDRFNGHSFLIEAQRKKASALLVEGNLDLSLMGRIKIPIIKVKNTTYALGDLAKFHRQKFDIPVIAVTGSNGKTTTKEMIWAILKEKFRVLKNEGTENNHIGIPMTLLRLRVEHEAAVLEMGMNHMGEIDYLSSILKPTIALITNIGAAHLEFLGSLENVLEAKAELLKYLKKDSVLILNSDDKLLKGLIKKSPCKVLTFGIKEKKCDFQGSSLSFGNDSVGFILNSKIKISLKIPGNHNIYNALAAISACSQFKIDFDLIKKALLRFKLPPNRLNLFSFKNFFILDDTYNSNPLSFMAAVDVILNFKGEGRKIVVCGDMLELGKESEIFHSEIGKLLAESGIDALIGIGELSRITVESARKSGMKEIFGCDSKNEIVKILKEFVRSGDIILFKGSRRTRMEEIIDCFTTSYTR